MLQNIVARAGFVHSLATGVNFVYTVANALFLADRTNGRAYATVLRLSSSVVCDLMYCG